MSFTPPTDESRSAEVLNLMCARFEAALAEGKVDAKLRAHELSCERCSDFTRELARVEALIAAATGPVERLPEGFLDDVLAKADNLDGRLTERRPSSLLRKLSALAVVSVAAAAVLLAFWAGAAREQLKANETRTQVQVAVPSAPMGVPLSADRPNTIQVSEAMKPLLAPTPSPSIERTRVEPRVPAAASVPEPVVDIGAEIQVMLREKVSQSEGCPPSSSVPVWVTATVQRDGSLTDRSVMSAGSASAAHRCVSRALDQLLLPPGMPTTTVTFELSW